MIQYQWGPHLIVPSKAPLNYSGCVLLREDYDEELLRKQIDARGITGSISRIRNLWFYRQKNSETWTKIGESCDILGNFRVKWDTTCLENGQYEILGFMLAILDSVKRDVFTIAHGEYENWYKPIPAIKHLEKWILGEQNIVEVTVAN
jgi:hypothetical protein